MALNEPHTVTRVRPTSAPNAAGETVLTYSTPPAVRKTHKGFFQMRGGRFVSTEEGMGYNLNAFLYTTETDVQNQDLYLVAIPGTTGVFRVMNVETKYKNLRGEFSHNRLALEKDTAVIT